MLITYNVLFNVPFIKTYVYIEIQEMAQMINTQKLFAKMGIQRVTLHIRKP